MTFLGNSRTLLTCCDEPSCLVWDIGRLVRLGRKQSAVPPEPDKVWHALADVEPTPAYRFIFDLADDPKLALPFLQKRLQPLPRLDATKVAALIVVLADERFAERERAGSELMKLDDRVIPLLRMAQEKSNSAEQRKRLADMLRSRESRSDRLRQSRVLRVLELIGQPAVPLLRELARHPDAEFKADAEVVLDRVLRRAAQ